jgi:prepilin-type processing-associated H-X9-DG protein
VKTRTKFACAFAAVILLALISLADLSLRRASATAARVKCDHYLRALHSTVQLYQNENRGALPHDLHVIQESQDISLSIFRCPAVRTNNDGDPRDIDYLYVDWSNLANPNEIYDKRYPLMYDAALANHGGGINILLTDGSRLWDPGAQWLKQFAAAHPETKIPLPR